MLTKLAIIGRPNVGKSSLFNCICKKRLAIVDEAEGVTRDRLYIDADLFGKPFQLIDTGGIDPRSKLPFNEEVKRQAEVAIEEADTLIMVVDFEVGVTTLDEEVANLLLRTGKPVCLAVNKVDNNSKEDEIWPFYSLGIQPIIPISCTQNWHIAELLEAALPNLTAPTPKEEVLDFETEVAEEVGTDDEAEEWDEKEIEENAEFQRAPPITEQTIHLAIVGRPNVGKSSLINKLLNEPRCIVSSAPGTTRDAVDITFKVDDSDYLLIDTAGIRKKQAEHEAVEKFAAIRTQRAIERSNLCLLMIDAQVGITEQDKKIASMINKAGKGCLLLFNKWDLVKGVRMEHCLRQVQEEIPFLIHCPKIFTSAVTGRNLEKIFPQVQQIFSFLVERISTGELNRFLEKSLQKNPPPMINGKRLRIYYMSQVTTSPPRFILFVNNPQLLAKSYLRYLYNQFRETYSFAGVPLFFSIRGKRKLEEV